MKGLLIKDFKILLNQKRFLLMFICLAVILSFSMDSTFVVSYISMIGLIMMLSTIAYDYNDDGFSFLMTLPIKPGDYAVAKYVFSIMGVTLFWLISLVIQFAVLAIQKESYVLSDTVLLDVSMLALFLVILSVLLPIDIRFSPEKVRVVMFIIFGIIMAGVLAGKAVMGILSDKFGMVFFSRPNPFETVSPAVLIIGLFAIAIIFLSISMMYSIRVMQKREF
ncbi:MAG: ABC-2 transporter permease [Lachnospiraceae bacterium]|nr:ABC-2 transporter permease [Lachnospiraceae bacterium]